MICHSLLCNEWIWRSLNFHTLFNIAGLTSCPTVLFSCFTLLYFTSLSLYFTSLQIVKLAPLPPHNGNGSPRCPELQRLCLRFGWQCVPHELQTWCAMLAMLLLARLTCFIVVFCSDCSHTLFARSQKCPVCGARLGEGNIAEAVVGVQGPLMQETLFSFALQSNDWTSILDNVAKVQALAAELSEFARHQLLQDHLRLVDSTNQVSGHYEAQKTELVCIAYCCSEMLLLKMFHRARPRL